MINLKHTTGGIITKCNRCGVLFDGGEERSYFLFAGFFRGVFVTTMIWLTLYGLFFWK